MCYNYYDEYEDCNTFTTGSLVGLIIGIIIFKILIISCIVYYRRRRRAIPYMVAPNGPVTVVQTTSHVQSMPQCAPMPMSNPQAANQYPRVQPQHAQGPQPAPQYAAGQIPMTNPQTTNEHPKFQTQHVQAAPQYAQGAPAEMPPAYSDATNPTNLPPGFA